MKDMLLTGDNPANFSHHLSEFIGVTNYYLKSGYFSPSDYEISLIHSFYTEISKMILFAKTDMKSASNRYALYKDYCKVRHMLSGSFFVNVTLLRKDEYVNVGLNKCSQQFEKVHNSYKRCKHSFPYKKISDKTLPAETPPSFNNESVLIGVLRNREQLEICIKNGFYHIPYKKLPVPAEEISYIAIYQSKNLFGDYAGIKYYGKVDSYKLVKRSEIREIPKNSDEKYYRFNITKWQTLPHTITNNGGLNVFEITTHHLLLHSKDVSDLKIKKQSVLKRNSHK